MRKEGSIVSWDFDKAYGFIKPNAGGKQLFIYVTDIKYRKAPTKNGQLITYLESVDEQGRPRAVDGVLVGSESRKPEGHFFMLFSWTFILALTIAVLLNKIPQLILIIYGGLSLVTFLLYWKDKSAAKKGRWRTPENSLHVLALLGGWPGALIGQQWLRHKSRKGSFKAILWLTVTINCGLLYWLLLIPDGQDLMNRVLRSIN